MLPQLSEAARYAVRRVLGTAPLDEVVDRLLEPVAGLEAENVAGPRGIGEAMPNVPGAELAQRLGLETPPQLARQDSRELEHAQRPAGAHVQHMDARLVRVERQRQRASDVANVDEIAALSPV